METPRATRDAHDLFVRRTMGKKGKGTGSFGSRRNKSHTLCRRYVVERDEIRARIGELGDARDPKRASPIDRRTRGRGTAD